MDNEEKNDKLQKLQVYNLNSKQSTCWKGLIRDFLLNSRFLQFCGPDSETSIYLWAKKSLNMFRSFCSPVNLLIFLLMLLIKLSLCTSEWKF